MKLRLNDFYQCKYFSVHRCACWFQWERKRLAWYAVLYHYLKILSQEFFHYESMETDLRNAKISRSLHHVIRHVGKFINKLWSLNCAFTHFLSTQNRMFCLHGFRFLRSKGKIQSFFFSSKNQTFLKFVRNESDGKFVFWTDFFVFYVLTTWFHWESSHEIVCYCSQFLGTIYWELFSRSNYSYDK